MSDENNQPQTLNYERPSQEPKTVRGWIVLLVMFGFAVGMAAFCLTVQRFFK